MTIIIGWAHVGFKYFSFILGMGFPVLSEHPVRHGLTKLVLGRSLRTVSLCHYKGFDCARAENLIGEGRVA